VNLAVAHQTPRRRRPTLRARRRAEDERGSSTVEFVIGAALMVFMLMAIMQLAIYFHMRSVATTAAHHGLDRVRVVNGTSASGIAAANEFLDQGGRSLESRSVEATRTQQTATVTVTGRVIAVIPLLDLRVSVTLEAPSERVTP
jgi:Flp pilus assembly protein TadG